MVVRVGDAALLEVAGATWSDGFPMRFVRPLKTKTENKTENNKIPGMIC